MKFLSPYLDFLSWGLPLVHSSVRQDKAETAKHLVFFFSHLCAGLFSVSLIPILLVFYDQKSLLEVFIFPWFLIPLLIANYLSLSSLYERACLFSTTSVIGSITFGAILTGGLISFLTPWLVVVLFFSVFFARRRFIFCTGGLVFASFLFLALVDILRNSGVLSSEIDTSPFLGILIVLLSFLSATGMFWGVSESRRRGPKFFPGFAETREILLWDEASDLLTKHSLNGCVTHSSASSLRFLGVSPPELKDDGMLEHVHPSDQLLFLRAIQKAGESRRAVRVEYRILYGSSLSPLPSSGRFFWVESICRSGQVFYEGDFPPDSCRNITLVTRNIHDRKLHEQARGSYSPDLMQDEEDFYGAGVCDVMKEFETTKNPSVGNTSVELPIDVVRGDVDLDRFGYAHMSLHRRAAGSDDTMQESEDSFIKKLRQARCFDELQGEEVNADKELSPLRHGDERKTEKEKTERVAGIAFAGRS
ncbi:MAG: PAS domain-containing protein [Alphaproteobacteria bacterium]|nr:PAS domain-containing protein [Alphaproteobacteria bacterium]